MLSESAAQLCSALSPSREKLRAKSSPGECGAHVCALQRAPPAQPFPPQNAVVPPALGGSRCDAAGTLAKPAPSPGGRRLGVPLRPASLPWRQGPHCCCSPFSWDGRQGTRIRVGFVAFLGWLGRGGRGECQAVTLPAHNSPGPAHSPDGEGLLPGPGEGAHASPSRTRTSFSLQFFCCASGFSGVRCTRLSLANCFS